ncbi:MAG: hypothetical protein CL533_04355 [Afipia sp.]|nr:hypothetical protein [Afipia sp.]OUX62341.1 MAG: hypothetical protein CBB64_04335 [Afipia sp. TMED4]HCX19051.1 hypothetical protein [Afipia sp.]
MSGKDFTPQQYHKALKGVIKRAIIVLDALGDAEMRFLSFGKALNRAADDPTWNGDQSVLAYDQTTFVRLIPTAREIAQAEIVESWLTWLGRAEGRTAVPRLVAWAHDDPIWRIADRERCSPRTIHYRLDKSIAAILKHFGDVEMDLQEPGCDERSGHPAFMVERPAAVAEGTRSGFGKVWIDGIGMMRDGRRIFDGREKISDRLAHAS